MCFSFFRALGHQTGDSLVEDEVVAEARKLLERAEGSRCRLELPEDLLVAERFDAAAPAEGLPRLQVADIGDTSTDYGDYFVSGLVGGILAAERRPQAAAAVAMFVVAQGFNQLFLVVDSLPGTVPPTLVMLGVEVLKRRPQPGPLSPPARASGRAPR
jgi:hypothetical protein